MVQKIEETSQLSLLPDKVGNFKILSPQGSVKNILEDILASLFL